MVRLNATLCLWLTQIILCFMALTIHTISRLHISLTLDILNIVLLYFLNTRIFLLVDIDICSLHYTNQQICVILLQFLPFKWTNAETSF